MTTQENLEFMKQFGIKLMFFKTLNKILLNSHSKISYKVQHINEKLYREKIKQICCQTYNFYKNSDNLEIYSNKNKNKNKYYIFTMWWQGENQAPEIVKACINSIKKNAIDIEVIIIDQNNYNMYTNIPKNIIKKLNDKKMTLTQFSDIVRFSVLKDYKSLWIDSTIFVTGKIYKQDLDVEFFSSKQEFHKYINGGIWSCFLLGGTSWVYSFLYDLFIEYWTKQDFLINYLLIDYGISIAYHDFENFKENLNKRTVQDVGILELRKHLNDPFNEQDFIKITENSRFHKLSYYWDTEPKIYNDNKLTIWGYLLNSYKED